VTRTDEKDRPGVELIGELHAEPSGTRIKGLSGQNEDHKLRKIWGRMFPPMILVGSTRRPPAPAKELIDDTAEIRAL